MLVRGSRGSLLPIYVSGDANMEGIIWRTFGTIRIETRRLGKECDMDFVSRAMMTCGDEI